ncbi:MAG: polysaccharide ABC transporter ATP-binding protein, partial [Burkholderiales bacterium]
TGREAEAKLIDIIDFAELEEYIEQPVKTYSTGMMARLTFAASTTITPELLVIDEILSVGDAYFAQKSFERIRQMCAAQSTTVLLVSHDIYSASKLCERMIWVERGELVIDGASPEVMKAYEDSIRTQEESRLRKNRLLRLEEAHRQVGTANSGFVLIELRTRGNIPVSAPVYFSRIAIAFADGEVLEAPLNQAEKAEASMATVHLDLAVGVWGPSGDHAGRTSRPMLGYGSPFNKVSVIFPSLTGSQIRGLKSAKIVIDCISTDRAELLVHAHSDSSAASIGEVSAGVGSWATVDLPLAPLTLVDAPLMHSESANTSGIHGSGVIRVLDIRILDARNSVATQIVHGTSATIEIDIELRDRAFRGRPQVLLAFQKDGVTDVSRSITRDFLIDGARASRGTIRAHFRTLSLGVGNYAISVMIAAEGYYDDRQTIFFSINPNVYVCISRALEFVVVGAGAVAVGTGVVVDASWSSDLDSCSPVTDRRATARY